MPSGHYEILRPIGAGGMAELYLARARGDDGYAQLVVLKRILPHLARDTAFIEMFLNEARIAATLRHPNIVAVTDFGQRDGDYFLTMEYVHGADLGELLERTASADWRLPLEVALTIVQHACAGLHHAHELRGPDGQLLEVVHRDVSPSNVMVSYDGAIKMTDFGIATAAALTRTTRAGTLKGKVSYMSPEQCRGGRIDRRADVFALGILLYETTLMTRLFVGDNDYALMTQVIEGRVTPPSDVEPGYPPGLEAIVMRALAVDPQDRFATAEEMQRAIEAYATVHGLLLAPQTVASFVGHVLGPRAHPSIELASSSATRVVAIPRRRSRTWMFGAAAIAVLALAVGGVTLAQPEATPVRTPVAVEPSHERASQPPPRPPPPTTPPAVVVLPTPVPVPAATAIVESPPPDEEELIVIEDEPGTVPERPRKRRRNGGSKTLSTYDLDGAAPPR